MYSDYEIRALQEIREWEEAKPGLVIRALDVLGGPITMIIENVPGKTRSLIARAIAGFMEKLRDASYWTYSDRGIIKKAARRGIRASCPADLAGAELEKLDLLARSHFRANRIIASLEGAGCGLGGLGLIAADIPALLGISFRAIQQIGTCYGLNMQDPAMLPVILGIIHAGSGFSVAVKSSVLADMHIAASALAGSAVYGTLAEHTKTAVLVELVKKSSRALPEKIARNITGRKLSQAIPILGAALGAGFNYWFMSTTMLSAYMVFRKITLERRHPPDRKVAPETRSLSGRRRRTGTRVP